MRSLGVVAFLMLTLAFGGPAAAQSPPGPAIPTPADYLLGNGDIIEVTVFGQPTLSVLQIPIGPDGFITLPLVGRVKAAGLTPVKLASGITDLYRKYLRNPMVTVRVVQFRVERVFVMGQVTRPGEYQLQVGEGILSVLAKAGGLGPRADNRKVVIMRGPQTIPIDLNQAFLAESRGQMTPILPGDVIFVPESDRRVTVLGQVVRPGTYEYLEGQRLSDAIAAAGGLTQLAEPRKAALSRGGENLPIDLAKILAGDVEANLLLQPGDLVVIPEAQNRVAVLGFVNRPGSYTIREGDRIMDAIVMAGGNTDRGNLSAVNVIRMVDGKPKVIALNVSRTATQGDLTQNVLLQDRDVVFVPEVGSMDPTRVLPWLNIVNLLLVIFGII